MIIIYHAFHYFFALLATLFFALFLELLTALFFELLAPLFFELFAGVFLALLAGVLDICLVLLAFTADFLAELFLADFDGVATLAGV
jgi:hypothetical protein